MNWNITNYFWHDYNNTRFNERELELALAIQYANKHPFVTELGAVTPYYFRSNVGEVVDIEDPRATIFADATSFDFTGKDVLSISTVEHIGELGEPVESAYECVKRIYETSHSCLISWPIGYNKKLDNDIERNILKFNYHGYCKIGFHNWQEVGIEVFSSEYGTPFMYGNGIIVLYKE